MAHSLLSPSAAHRWMNCAASLKLESELPESTSDYADEGTAAHEFAARRLLNLIDENARPVNIGDEFVINSKTYTYNIDMAAYLDKYVDVVWEMANHEILRVEERVDFSNWTLHPDSFGTADAVIIKGNEIQIHDLKYGRGVPVDAVDNEQLMIYALGAVDMFEIAYEFDQVRLVIHQPRLNSMSEHVLTVVELKEFGNKVREKAQIALAKLKAPALTSDDFTPGVKHCRWCKAKATCPALTQHVMSTVADDFVDISKDIKPQLESAEERVQNTVDRQLANCMLAVELIEDWCSAVRAEVERRLLAGTFTDNRYKLVEGRKGARKWMDATAVEEAMKAMRLKREEMYEFSLISPTTAEKLFKDQPKRWAKLQELITQSEGKPSVAPASDKRPAIIINDFEVLV